MKNKITITCTKRQKAYITRSLINAGMCLWPKKEKMCGFDKSSDCMRCFEKNINWIIADEQRKAVQWNE